jgi:hypothetical protein
MKREDSVFNFLFSENSKLKEFKEKTYKFDRNELYFEEILIYLKYGPEKFDSNYLKDKDVR